MAKVNFDSTFEYKLIYIFRINDETHKGFLKIGDATIHTTKKYTDLQPNCHDLNYAARQRINSYTGTAAISYDLLWTEIAVYKNNDPTSKKYGKILAFRDYDVHNVLKRSGIPNKQLIAQTIQNEWFKCDLETAKKAIQAVKRNQSSLDNGDISTNKSPIVFRPEQQAAIEKTLKQYKNGDRMLWNAKMRFGKTLTALEVAKRSGFSRTIIITHRPVVSKGWYEDFSKIFYDSPDYEFGSKTRGKPIEELETSGKKYVYFASMQDLRGSEQVGGNFDKNDIIFQINWDFVVVDEAHEGTQTKLGQSVLQKVIKPEDKDRVTKTLELSGTPFNLLVDYDDVEIYTWDYIMEQEAKMEWTINHYGDSNPYEELPKLNIFTYHLEENFKSYMDLEDKAFNFREFFRIWTGDISKDGKQMPAEKQIGDFVHEEDIRSFLNLICKDSDVTNYPFASEQYRGFFRHTLWILPGVKEAKAFSKLLRSHPIFSQFEIVNVAGPGDEEINSQTALEAVQRAIGENPDETRSITLSCGRLTTGVSVPEWTAVLMLAGSYSTQASQYLQTIFRVQTPANINGRIKENCYVFDFAPDRTLKMVAESVQLSQRGMGTQRAELRLQAFLNYCPVISIDHTGMKVFKVSYLLQELKKAYAERVVRNGFDDNSLYNDELLKLTDVDLAEFARLKAIIGSSAAQDKIKKIKINTEGFTEEEYEASLDIESKPRKTLTPEEQEALSKLKKLREQKKGAISILRGISIRIPLLVFGADVPITKDITVQSFPSLVDDMSWKEFMPNGVTKEDFRLFSKYYDEDIFVRSTYQIRNIAKAADELEPTDRIKKITQLFSTFRNPDKETVLTPWRVVNIHLSSTIGGYDFWDENHENELDKPRFVNQEKVTSKVFSDSGKVLEINSKTGLYPLYVAYTFYRKSIDGLPASSLSSSVKNNAWIDAIKNNIFVICKTKMAKQITQRTLMGYQSVKINAHSFDDLVNQLKSKKQQFVEKVTTSSFWNKEGKDMKFSAVVGNPPYQAENPKSTRKDPVYHYFYDAAFKCSDLVTLISPARFLFNAGQTPTAWNKSMLHDPHLKVVQYFPDPHKVFANVDIKGGVVIMLRDKQQDFGEIGKFSPSDDISRILNKILEKNSGSMLSTLAFPKSTFTFSEILFYEHPELKEKVTKGNEYALDTGIFDKIPEVFFDNKPDKGDYLCVLGRQNNHRQKKFILRKYIKTTSITDKFKVFITDANGRGTMGETLSNPVIGIPGECATQTFMSFGPLSSYDEALNLAKYMRTKFLRFLLGTLKVTQHNTPDTWSNIPTQDFSLSSDIKWSSSIDEIDQQLYEKYDLSDEDISWLDSNVKRMSE